MPSIQKRVVSVAEQIATLQARATKLETFSPNGGTVIAQGNGNATSMAYSGSWANVAFNDTTYQPTIRPIPILAIATVGQFYASGGTATFTTCRLAVLANDVPVLVNDFYGQPMVSGMASVANATNENGTATFIIACTLPAGPPVGSWYFRLQHIETGGAITTFNMPGTIGGTAATTFTVLQLAG
jgi:hypothetical protein